MIQMKAVKTHVGRCDSCGEPADMLNCYQAGEHSAFVNNMSH